MNLRLVFSHIFDKQILAETRAVFTKNLTPVKETLRINTLLFVKRYIFVDNIEIKKVRATKLQCLQNIFSKFRLLTSTNIAYIILNRKIL